MHIFISYSRAYGDTAESIAIRLREDGHNVFFDSHNLQAAEEFDAEIRREIDRADLFIFLITPEAVRDGSYTRTELDFAQRRWPKPSGRILPVMLEPTPVADVPAYARAVTILQARGNLVAEVAACVAGISRRYRLRRLGYLMASVVLLALLSVAAYPLVKEYLSADPGPGPVDTCYLQFRLHPAPSDAPTSLILRVSGSGVSQDFSTAANGTASIHVTGKQLAAWEVTVIDRDGRTLGAAALSGCPDTTSSHALSDQLGFDLGPRDARP